MRGNYIILRMKIILFNNLFFLYSQHWLILQDKSVLLKSNRDLRELLCRGSGLHWVSQFFRSVSLFFLFPRKPVGFFGCLLASAPACSGISGWCLVCLDPLFCSAANASLLLWSRIVFPHRKKTIKPDEIVYKKYILSLGVFHFGPLLCGKSREK